MKRKLMDFALYMVEELGYSVKVDNNIGRISLTIEVDTLEDNYEQRLKDLINKGAEIVGKDLEHKKTYLSPVVEKIEFLV